MQATLTQNYNQLTPNTWIEKMLEIQEQKEACERYQFEISDIYNNSLQLDENKRIKNTKVWKRFRQYTKYFVGETAYTFVCTLDEPFKFGVMFSISYGIIPESYLVEKILEYVKENNLSELSNEYKQSQIRRQLLEYEDYENYNYYN